jgi:hypothetical protein
MQDRSRWFESFPVVLAHAQRWRSSCSPRIPGEVEVFAGSPQRTENPMTTTYLPPNTTMERFDAAAVDDAQLAAMSFLARYSGRTLEAYRYDLRYFFQWSADSELAVLDATTQHSRCCWDSTGCGSAKHAAPTSRTSASSAVTAPCTSSAKATSPQ